MNVLPGKEIPGDILDDSVLAHIAAAYFAVGKGLERRTQCSATRGFVLSALRDGASLNQNQIATLLGIDRTVVHRAIKSLVQEELVAEQKTRSGRAIPLQLTPRGKKYREGLIAARQAADDRIRQQMSQEERRTLLKLLKLVVECEL